MLLNAVFGLDLLRYPDDPDLMEFGRATTLMGRGEAARTRLTDEIRFIDG